MNVIEYTPDSFTALKKQWQLLESGEDMTAFQQYDWYMNINSLYRKEKTKNIFRKWIYFLVTQNDEPVLIAPIQICKVGIGYQDYGIRRGCYFIGRRGYTDYLNFIYKDFSGEAVQLVIDHIKKKYFQTYFYLEQMLEKSDSFCYLERRYSPKKITVACAALRLPETFEEYKSLLSKSTRQNIRTAINRAAKNDVGLTHELIYDADSSITDELEKICESRQGIKEAHQRKEMSFLGFVYSSITEKIRQRFSAGFDVFNDSKNTFLILVRDGANIASFFWGIRNTYNREWYVIKVGVSEDYQWYSPNISHLYLFIKDCYDKDSVPFSLLDFTRGAEGYKKTIGCTQRETSGIIFKNR